MYDLFEVVLSLTIQIVPCSQQKALLPLSMMQVAFLWVVQGIMSIHGLMRILKDMWVWMSSVRENISVDRSCI